MTGLDLAKRTVIVVEDEAFTRQTVVRLLVGMGATNVVQAEDGEAALAESWIIGSGPVLVISDFNMPKIDGLELLKTVRMGQCGLERGVPFVMLTAYSDRDLVDVALKLDVSAFLVKPVSRAALEKRLNHLARSEQDTSWLKSVDAYDAIDTVVSDEVLNPGSTGASEQKSAAADNAKRGTSPKGSTSADIDEDADSKRPRISVEASQAGAELLEHLLSNEPDVEAPEFNATTIHTGFVERLTNFVGDDNIAAGVGVGIERLNAEFGGVAASGILLALDRIEREGTLTMGDIADVLNTGSETYAPSEKATVTVEWKEQNCSIDELPELAVSTQEIFTASGGVLIAAGTQMNATVIRLLGQLAGRNALDLPSDTKTGRPVVRVVVPPGAAKPEPVVRTQPRVTPRPVPKKLKGPERSLDPTEIAAGFVLSRDIHTANGALYLGAGTTLTQRHVGVLESLYEAGKLTSKIWVAV